jgi:hypothetical protein
LTQLQRQREKEHRLKEILKYIRTSGIGVGSQTNTDQSYCQLANSSRGYRNYLTYRLYALIGVEPDYTEASAAYAIFSGTENGTIYPRDPAVLVNPIGYVASISSDPFGGSVQLELKHRFIRGLPHHPFADWYPVAHWEFRAVTTDGSGGPGPWFETWPYDHATGVIDIRSVGAGLSISGENTDTW